MGYRIAVSTAAAAILVTLALAFPNEERPSQTRWIVSLQNQRQLAGLLQAAEARGCEEHIRTNRFISFDCPQGQPPTPEAQAATRYVRHDSTTNTLIRASNVHAGIPPGAFDGDGVRVAVIDSGVDTDHPAFSHAVVECLNTTGDPNGCEDIEGHGTAVSAIVAGIVAAAGTTVTADSVAPRASIIAIKVFPDSGAAIYSDDVAAALLLAVSYDPDVINLSLGGGKSTLPDCDGSGDPAVDAINTEAAAAGIVVVVSAGNDRHKDGVSFPACASQAIAVGAVYQRDEGRAQWAQSCTDRTTEPDLVTCFSNVGPALDVVAPGAFLWTAALGGNFGNFHGTSAAAPVVSGAAALLKQQQPALTAAAVREALASTALEVGDARNQDRNGEGRIDCVHAAEHVAAHFQPCTADGDCGDDNLCNGAETCTAGTCAPGMPPAPCDDGNACNGAETCEPSSGACVAGTPPDCDDGDVCTDDSCDPAAGCVHAGNGTCPVCTPVSKGRCNCDGVCSTREAAFGSCGDCP
jgi:hypothetical protein